MWWGFEVNEASVAGARKQASRLALQARRAQESDFHSSCSVKLCNDVIVWRTIRHCRSWPSLLSWRHPTPMTRCVPRMTPCLSLLTKLGYIWVVSVLVPTHPVISWEEWAVPLPIPAPMSMYQHSVPGARVGRKSNGCCFSLPELIYHTSPRDPSSTHWAFSVLRWNTKANK